MSCQIQSDICGSYTNNGRMFPSPLPTYRFRDIMDVFIRYIAGNERDGVTEEFYVLHKTKSPFPLALIRITLVGLFQPLGFTSIK